MEYKTYVMEEAYNYIDADPKRLAAFLLGKYGQIVEHREFDSFDVLTYRLPSPPAFVLAESLHPQSTRFGTQLMLVAADHGAYGVSDPQSEAVPSGSEAWVVLRWQVLEDLDDPLRNHSFQL